MLELNIEWIPAFAGMTKKQISALICVHLRLMNLKKQSQFRNGQIGVSSYLKGFYDKNTLCGARKTKPIYLVLRSA
jgi:hypothetical protein